MKKILLVDDDATIREIYRLRFLHEGFEVETAADGLLAAKALRANKPDLVVLDLMMPRLSGVDVLRFIRSQADLANLPVIIFTNSFLSELAEAANGLGIQRAIVKANSSPDELMSIINEILMATPTAAPAATGIPTSKLPGVPASPTQPSPKVRQQFLDNAHATLATLRSLFRDFDECADPMTRGQKLESLYRKAHFVATISGMAECHHIALLGGAFEALLFELQQRPNRIDSSTIHTITATMDFLELLFDKARGVSSDQPLSANVLIVDDDPLSNHLAVAALRRANLIARAADNPLTGLEMLKQKRYELVLLDIEMPHMNGFDMCRKLRTLPGYADTPVIYVTAHTDFDSRSSSILAGGNDLIAKPIFPIELAVKAVMHLIRSYLPATAAGR